MAFTAGAVARVLRPATPAKEKGAAGAGGPYGRQQASVREPRAGAFLEAGASIGIFIFL